MDESSSIRYVPSGVPWLRRMHWFVLPALLAWCLLAFFRHRPATAYIFPSLLLLSSAWQLTGRGNSVVVDDTGIKLPLRRRISWTDVDHVEQPDRWSTVVTLHLKDGATRPIGLPPAYAEQVARIGAVPLGAAAGS